MLYMPLKEKLNIHIIGAGGTGGYCVEYLARLLSGGSHKVHLYDGDRVELKNLKRQNFCIEDLDKNKAEVLCARLSAEILDAPELIPHGEYLTSPDALMAEILLSLEPDESLVILLAVDNVATRKLANEVIFGKLAEKRILTVALDSGNHNEGGQVVLYANGLVGNHGPFGDVETGLLPSMLELYPDMAAVKDDNPGLADTCAENAESEPQAMMANVRNGELLALITVRLKEIGRVPGNLWTSDILTGNTRCTFTGFQELD